MNKKRIALVLSGGGARGAYEAGVIHYIRTMLPPHIAKHRTFDILCGSSVGAINTCFLAATSHNLEYQGIKAYEFWKNLKQDDIYKRGVASVTKFIGRTVRGIGRNFFRKKTIFDEDSPYKNTHFRSLLDASPFPVFLKRVIPWNQISLNIQNGSTQAISIVATNIHTGRVELFIDKHPSLVYSGRHMAHFCPIEPHHALASAAIPILFPCVRVHKNYYCDGGLRLSTPLSPAIQLGADKALVIGLRHASERAEHAQNEAFSDIDIPPTLGEMMGQVLKTIFVDRLDYDLAQMRRLNKITEAGKAVYGPDFLNKINDQLMKTDVKKDISARGLKELEVMSIFPTADVRKIFSDCMVSTNYLKKNLTPFEKMLLKMLDVDIQSGLDFLTFILFIPGYLSKLIELGFEDAKSNHDKLVAFFEE